VFQRMRNWRVGIEARISQLKRSFGLRRTRLRRLHGAGVWVGLGVFAYNLQRMTVRPGDPTARAQRFQQPHHHKTPDQDFFRSK
jgi:hypothetical protein